jgi:hypothetical protein
MLTTLLVAVVLDYYTHRVDDLSYGVWRAAPKALHLSRERAREFTIAAIRAETSWHTAEDLLGQTIIETRFSEDAISHAKGGRFCGPIQVSAETPARCHELADLDVGYAAGIAALKEWRKSCRSPRARKKHDIKSDVSTCALAGYGGGWPAIDHSTYPRRVHTWSAKIRRFEREPVRARAHLHQGRIRVDA